MAALKNFMTSRRNFLKQLGLGGGLWLGGLPAWQGTAQVLNQPKFQSGDNLQLGMGSWEEDSGYLRIGTGSVFGADYELGLDLSKRIFNPNNIDKKGQLLADSLQTLVLSFPSDTVAFDALLRGQIESAIVPLENFYGDVYANYQEKYGDRLNRLAALTLIRPLRLMAVVRNDMAMALGGALTHKAYVLLKQKRTAKPINGSLLSFLTAPMFESMELAENNLLTESSDFAIWEDFASWRIDWFFCCNLATNKTLQTYLIKNRATILPIDNDLLAPLQQTYLSTSLVDETLLEHQAIKKLETEHEIFNVDEMNTAELANAVAQSYRASYLSVPYVWVVRKSLSDIWVVEIMKKTLSRARNIIIYERRPKFFVGGRTAYVSLSGDREFINLPYHQAIYR